MANPTINPEDSETDAPTDQRLSRMHIVVETTVRPLWEGLRRHIPNLVNSNLPALHNDRRSRLLLREQIHQQCVPYTRGGFYYLMGKRLFDIAIAISALPILFPVMTIIALLIRLESSGPALFRQERTGQFGRRFVMYKFRTMVHNAEELKSKLQQENVHRGDSPDFKVIDDPRVTALGNFLRKTSFDELPNLINVLLGNMSLVGPRPTSFDSSSYGTENLVRLSVKPGITGLWQVSGRANLSFEQRVQLDRKYIEKMSLTRDLVLVIRTVFNLRNGAY